MQGGLTLSSVKRSPADRIGFISRQFEISQNESSESLYFLSSEEQSPIQVASDSLYDWALVPCDIEEMDETEKLEDLFLQVRNWEFEGEENRYLSIKTTSNLRHVFTILIKKMNDEALTDLLGVIDYLIEELRSVWRRLNPPLDISAQRGLFGELWVLQQLILSGGSSVIEYWKGPLNEMHDFKSKSTHLEIKTTTTHPPQINISSAKQMYTIDDKSLYLIIVQLEESDQGITLPKLVNLVEHLCSKNEDYALLQTLLNEVGYNHNDSMEYTAPYIITKISELEIDDTSPVISRSEGSALHSNISELKYKVDLTGISMAEIDDERCSQFVKLLGSK